ncbi:MAG: translocation/assembly module TamB domain-containing protein [Asticcacaulis sp.]
MSADTPENPEGKALPKPAPEDALPAPSADSVQSSTDAAPGRIRGWRSLDWRSIRWPRVAAYSAVIIAIFALLAGGALLTIDSRPGKRFIVNLINGYTLPAGIKVHIGSIDGSLYNDLTLRDVSLSDAKGIFVTSPWIHLDWRPFGYLSKHVDIRDLSSPLIAVSRLPDLQPTPPQAPNGPLLPDLKIDLNRLQVNRITLAAGVAGKDARVLNLSATAHIIHRRAQLYVMTASDKADNVNIALDAAPDQDRFNLNGHITAPAKGVIVSLLHLDKPLLAGVSGQGGWKSWQGAVEARLGDDPLVDLKVAGQSGTFHITGVTRPDLLVSGDSVALLKPQVSVDTMIATRANRSFDITLALASQALAVNANGLVDLAVNRFGHLDVQARLLHPEILDKSFSGQDIHASLRFDGAFASPRIDYDIAATRFGLGRMFMTGLRAQGRSHMEGGVLTLPLRAQMTSFSGLGDSIDPLLTHVSLNGDITLRAGRLNSDNLRLTSDRIDARAKVKGDTNAGNYTAAVDGRLNNYHIDQLGTVDLQTAANLAYAAKTGFTLNGHAVIDSTHWENPGLAKALGGNAHLTGDYSLSRDGAFTLTQLAGNAPQFQLLSGDFRYKDNAIAANVSAHSTQYGPLLLTLGGTVERPSAILKAASPGLGMQLANVVVTVNGNGDNAYAVMATGGSAYGPFSADTGLALSKPMVVDVHKAHFAGVDLAGRLQQTPQGPFAGTLTLNGSGLNGTATLASVDGDQGAAINATGSDVALPGTDVKIGRAIVTANAVLRQQMELNADVQAAQLVYANTVIDTGRARIVLHGDRGTMQAVLHGQKSYPFDVAINTDIEPAVLTVAMQGRMNGVPFGLSQPARIVKNGNDWDLNPTVLTSEGGRMTIAGHIGSQTKLQLRLDNLDLASVNMFAPDAGLGGTATGAVDFMQTGDAFPTAHANLKIDNFTRSSAATVSDPVGMVLDAALSPGGAPGGNYVHAVFREGAANVGRLQLTFRPGDGDGWVKQIMASAISGGVRYNGPAGLPFSMTGLGHQSVHGAVAVAADIAGRADAPQLTGAVRSDNLTYDNDTFGTRVTAVAMEGRFTNDRLELTRFSGNAGAGTVKGQGWVSLAANQHFPMQLHVDLNNARLASSDQINSTVSGSIDVVNNQNQGASITGNLRLPNLRYTVIPQGAAEINTLDGVHHKGYVLTRQAAPDDGGAPSKWKLDVNIRAPNQVFVQGMGLDSEWTANLHLIGTSDDPRLLGEMKVIRGRYSFAGRDFTISNGTITFLGGQITNPQIALTATADLNDINGIISVSGSAQRPDIAFSSTPALPQDEVLSRMLFGQSVTNLSATEALQLAAAVNGLRGGGGLNPLGTLRAATGIDRLNIVSADATTGRGTSLAAGKYLTNNIYVEVVTDARGFAATQLQVALSRTLSLLSQTGGVNGTAVSVKYQKDY